VYAQGRSVELRTLVLTASGDEPAVLALLDEMDRCGVPVRCLRFASGDRLTWDVLVDSDGIGRYQGIVVATDDLLAPGRSVGDDLDVARLLAEYEALYGVRRVVAYGYPSAALGFCAPFRSTTMDGIVGEVTTEGRRVFNELVGPVPFDPHAYGYLASPAPDTEFHTLVTGPDGSALVGVHVRADGREQMVMTFDANPQMLHALLLAPGVVRWLTRGVFLGHRRNYFSIHVDDVFSWNDRWDVEHHRTRHDDGARIRLRDADVARARAWSVAHGVRLDLAYNAAASDDEVTRGSDELTDALLLAKDDFGWVNHTYRHLHLGDADRDVVRTEVTSNLAWAQANDIRVDPLSVVTGEHSGLDRDEVLDTLHDIGVRWVASDASYGRDQQLHETIATVPRYPTNLYYNVGTRREQLDEYFCLHGSAGLPGGDGFDEDEWRRFVEREADVLLAHALGNDPRPHYVHQNNLAEEGTVYPVLETFLRRYRELARRPLLQPTMSSAGEHLRRQSAWRDAVVRDLVSARVRDGFVYVEVAADVEVPVTGVLEGDRYGPERSAWFPCAPEQPLVLIATPAL
jgi:hypothetical protein